MSETQVMNLIPSLRQAGLFPSSAPLIPEDFTPTTELQVTFGEKSVSLGNLFRVSDCKSAPKISFAAEVCNRISLMRDFPARGLRLINVQKRDLESPQTYTLLLIDPDAPTPDDPKFAYWRHWVVSGLQPSGAPETVQTLTEYLGPGPKDDSRPHRYLFLLFREPHGLSLSKEDVGGEEFTARRSFKAAEWVQQHGLELVAVNWMLGAGDGWHE